MMKQTKIFKDRNIDRTGLKVMSVGRLFQMIALATGNAPSPTVDRRVRGTTKRSLYQQIVDRGNEQRWEPLYTILYRQRNLGSNVQRETNQLSHSQGHFMSAHTDKSNLKRWRTKGLNYWPTLVLLVYRASPSLIMEPKEQYTQRSCTRRTRIADIWLYVTFTASFR